LAGVVTVARRLLVQLLLLLAGQHAVAHHTLGLLFLGLLLHGEVQLRNVLLLGAVQVLEHPGGIVAFLYFGHEVLLLQQFAAGVVAFGHQRIGLHHHRLFLVLLQFVGII